MKTLLSFFLFSLVASAAAEPKTVLSCKLVHSHEEDWSFSVLLGEEYSVKLVYVENEGYRLQVSTKKVEGGDELLYDKQATLIRKDKDVTFEGDELAFYFKLNEAELRGWPTKTFSALHPRKEYKTQSSGKILGREVNLPFICTRPK